MELACFYLWDITLIVLKKNNLGWRIQITADVT